MRSAMIRSMLALLAGVSLASASPILVDLDKAGRTGLTETGWNAWPVYDSVTVSRTFSGVTFTLSNAGSAGTSLTSDWYKAGASSPYNALLVSDGALVLGGDAGGAIRLVISGLSVGAHSLLSYHNTVNGNAYAEVNVDVNGSRKVTNLVTTNRATATDSAAFAYVSFTTRSGKPDTILFSPNMSSSALRNVVLNGFAVDVPNATYQAKNPLPSHRDLHVDADAGSAALSWSIGSGAVSHGLYLGTDSVTVANATTSSSSYKGKLTTASWSATGLSNLKTYWWRVDETDANGLVTKGNVWCFSPRHLAFPGAEGYGRFARGGRGGKVVHVTSLADSGAGTLRAAVENDIGPRTIVFDVSGIIVLKSRLTLGSDAVTIAGQTAPGKGVVIRACPFGLSGASDAVVRFLKVRLGYTGLTWDGTGMQGCDHSIMDHSSVSWTIDESFSSRSGKNITLQRTLISEALNVANHQNYPAGTMHGYAATISGDVGSFHHNLLAHNDGRNWSLGGGLDANGYYAGRLDIFNNVVYNWNDRSTDGGAHEVNFVNNYYKPGPATTFKMALNNQWDGFPGTQKYWCHGNLVKGVLDDTSKVNNGCQSSANGNAGVVNPDPWATAPFFPSYATVQTAVEAYKDVLSDVGVTMPAFDDHDLRMVRETREGTCTYKGSVSGLPGLIDRETDAGGYESYPELARASSFDTDGDGLPDWYESLIGTGAKSSAGDFTDANADPVGDGYTNLERYLDWMATPHAETKAGTAVTFNLASLFRGYNLAPVYKAGTNACLTTSIKDSTLTVTPTSGCGIVSLPLSVTDIQGAAKTRNVAVYVAPGGTVGLSRAAVARPRWEIRPGHVAVQLEGTGSLTLRDLSGRAVRQVTGSGRLEADLSNAPQGLLVAVVQAPGIREERMVQGLR